MYDNQGVCTRRNLLAPHAILFFISLSGLMTCRHHTPQGPAEQQDVRAVSTLHSVGRHAAVIYQGGAEHQQPFRLRTRGQHNNH